MSEQGGVETPVSAEFSRLPQLLTAAGYNRSIIEAVERHLNANGPGLINSRLLLEQFYRASTQMDKAVRYEGNPQSFGAALDFARSRGWLTVQEHRFVSALYGLLSDAAAHPGHSVMEPRFAQQAVIYALWLVLGRFQVRISHPFAGYGGSAGRLRLADQFLKGVRTGAISGPAFEVRFDQDLMQLTRQRLLYSDIKPLMSIIKSDEASSNLRSICASLVLSPRCYRKPRDDNWPRVTSELDRYCSENVANLPWKLGRCITLALANRTNNADRLLDYLEWISGDPELIERNLSDSEEYYGSADNALAYYQSRIERTDIPLSGCVWEAYYIFHRSPPKVSSTTKRVLERRINELEVGRLRTFYQSILYAVRKQ